jgi:hypothetical protein
MKRGILEYTNNCVDYSFNSCNGCFESSVFRNSHPLFCAYIVFPDMGNNNFCSVLPASARYYNLPEYAISYAIALRATSVCEVGSVSTMSRKTQVKKQIILKPTILKPTILKPTIMKPLRTVPFESGFHFYTAIGKYTGITATNLSEFATKLQTIPIESVKFHFQRKDFQKWIQYTLKDVALAERIRRIKGEQSAEGLRKEILRTVEAVLLHI